MSEKSIFFVNYNKLSQESDAFFFLDSLAAFYEFELDSNFSSVNNSEQVHTLGNTNNPNEVSINNNIKVKNTNLLNKINPFNSNFSQIIELYDSSENENQTIQDDETLSKESLIFLNLFFNKKQSNNTNIIKLSFFNNNFIDFELKNRSFDNISFKNNNIDLESIDIKDYNSSPTVYDFTSETNNTTVVNEVKSEIINNLNETINKFEQNILKTTVNKQEIINLENKIVQKFEEKLDQKESSIIKTIQDQNKKDINRSIKDLLNS